MNQIRKTIANHYKLKQMYPSHPSYYYLRNQANSHTLHLTYHENHITLALHNIEPIETHNIEYNNPNLLPTIETLIEKLKIL